jgi:hypothetical protein
VAVDAQGNVYVAAYGSNGCIHKFKANGRYTDTFGAYGTDDGQMNAPAGLAVDAQGNLYASDAEGHHVQVFKHNGKFSAKAGGPGTGNGAFDTPAGVAPDGQGGFLVADFKNHRVQKFVPGGDPEIAVLAGKTAITQDGSYDFGTTSYANPVSIVFTLDNSEGQGTLLVGGLTLPAGFALLGNFPVGVGPRGKATFTVQQTATAPGDYSGTLSVRHQRHRRKPLPVHAARQGDQGAPGHYVRTPRKQNLRPGIICPVGFGGVGPAHRVHLLQPGRSHGFRQRGDAHGRRYHGHYGHPGWQRKLPGRRPGATIPNGGAAFGQHLDGHQPLDVGNQLAQRQRAHRGFRRDGSHWRSHGSGHGRGT